MGLKLNPNQRARPRAQTLPGLRVREPTRDGEAGQNPSPDSPPPGKRRKEEVGRLVTYLRWAGGRARMEWSHALPDVVGEGAALRRLRRRRRREWRAPAARKGVVFLVGGRPPAVSVAPLSLAVVPYLSSPTPSSGPGRYGPISHILRPGQRGLVVGSIWAG